MLKTVSRLSQPRCLLATIALAITLVVAPFGAAHAEGEGGGEGGGLNQPYVPFSPSTPRLAARNPSGVPPVGETRVVPREVVFEVASATPQAALVALEQRNGLAQLELFAAQLFGTTLVRAAIVDGRALAAVITGLETEPAVLSAQPNYRFAMQQSARPRLAREDTELQYALAKLRLPQAHAIASGGAVLTAVIDSRVDSAHPELNGAIEGSFDALDAPGKPHSHGTAIAGLIAAHAKLTGAAPGARLLVVRAFDADDAGAAGGSFAILKGLDWAVGRGARVINLSFAGPSDPALRRALEAVHGRGIALIAAAGNAGPSSPPLYPGADPKVIAVTATDADDAIFPASNRGGYIVLAAPGVDLLVAAPGSAYRVQSGTSFAAAEVTGVVALLLERNPALSPDAVRATLLATGTRSARQPGIVLVDAYRALIAQAAMK